MARPAKRFRWFEFEVEEFGPKNADGQLIDVDKYIVSRPDGTYVCDVATLTAEVLRVVRMREKERAV